MGIFDKVKSDLEWKAGSEISGGAVNAAGGLFKKDNLPKCPKCKKPVQSGTRFCQGCGAKLIISCGKCNLEYPTGTKFCAKCGETLKE